MVQHWQQSGQGRQEDSAAVVGWVMPCLQLGWEKQALAARCQTTAGHLYHQVESVERKGWLLPGPVLKTLPLLTSLQQEEVLQLRSVSGTLVAPQTLRWPSKGG